MQTIKKWSLNNHSLHTIRKKLDDFDDSDLLKKASGRLGFDIDTKGNIVTIPTYFYRVNGIIGEEDEFYDRIFSLNEKLSRLGKLYLKFDRGLNKKLDNATINTIQKEWVILEKRGPINTSNIIRAIEKCAAIRRFTDTKHTLIVTNALRRLFDTYFEFHKENARPQEIKNILIYLIFWINLYLEPILQAFDFAGTTPKLLYYGNISKREAYFLYFFGFIGGDVIYLNSNAKCPFTEIDPENKLSSHTSTTRFLPLQPFPSERKHNVIETEAFVAGEELRETLHSEDSMFYRPWQLINYKIRSLTLRSTYEEIGILAQEQSIMRNGWEVGHGEVTIPNFFAKILGVHEDINRYYQEINELKKLPKTQFFESLPICKPVTRLLKAEYYSVSKRGVIDIDHLLNATFWPYNHLQIHVQKLIANCIIDFCQLKGIKRQRKYGVDEQKIVIFTTMLSLDSQLLQLIQMFDYPRQVPKCIIYNNETSGELIFEDSVLIYFFSKVGMDVLVYNPAGHNDIEIYIDESAYNIHHLSNVAFDLPLKSISIFGKFIK
jgi:hypothetical protein